MRKPIKIVTVIVVIISGLLIGNKAIENSRCIIMEKSMRSTKDISLGIVEGFPGLIITTPFDVLEKTVVEKSKRVANYKINDQLPFEIAKKFEASGDYSFEIPLTFNQKKVKTGSLKVELLNENYSFKIVKCKNPTTGSIGYGNVVHPFDLIYTVKLELEDGEIVEVSRIGWNSDPIIFEEASYEEKDIEVTDE